MKNTFDKLILVSLFGSLLSCATMFESQPNSGRMSGKVSFPQKRIVQLQSNKSPINAKVDRKTWIEFRDSSKELESKMYATLALGEYNVAITEAKSHIAKNPKSKSALTVLSMAYAGLADFQRALYYSNLISKYHDTHTQNLNLKALAILGKNKKIMKDYQQALSLLKESFDRSDDEIASGLNLGYLYLDMGDAKNALGTFEDTASRCGCMQAIEGVGIAAARSGEYTTAKNALNRLIDEDKDNEAAIYRLALVEKNGFNNHEAAAELLESIVGRTTRGDDRLRRRAFVLLRKVKGESPNKLRSTESEDYDNAKGLLDESGSEMEQVK